MWRQGRARVCGLALGGSALVWRLQFSYNSSVLLNRAMIAAGFESWWLHIRTTRHPELRSAWVTVRSRRMLRAIFAFQYLRLVLGGLKQRGQACQKQPSTNTTTRADRKVKSGFPISAWWRRQPDIPALRRRASKRISVSLFPRERILDISWERAFVVRRHILVMLIKCEVVQALSILEACLPG